MGVTSLGVLGSQVPSTGQHGAGYIYNDLSLPADANKEVRGLILTVPSAGTFAAFEDTSFTLSGAPDGTYTFTYRLFSDGADLGTSTATITIGAASGTVAPLASANTISTPAGTQNHVGSVAALTSADALSTVTGSSGGLTGTVASLTSVNTLSTVTGSASGGPPAVASLVSATTLSSPTGTQAHVGAVAALVSATALSTVAGAIPGLETEPVTLAEAKSAANIDASITVFDAKVQGLITAARIMAEHETGREYVAKTKRYVFADWPFADHVMHVHQPTAVAISYWDGAAWVAMTGGTFGFFEAELGTGIGPAIGTNWPTLGQVIGGPRIRVDITAGSAAPNVTAPENLKLYLKAIIVHWLQNPGAASDRSITEVPFVARLIDDQRLWN